MPHVVLPGDSQGGPAAWGHTVGIPISPPERLRPTLNPDVAGATPTQVSGRAAIWCPYRDDTTTMGEIAEEMSVSPQSDSEGSNSSTDTVGIPASGGTIKCRWVGCGHWFGHLDLLASHVTRVHAAAGHGGLFYCGWEGCTRGNRGFNARYKMLVHVRTHTNEKPHHCFKCDKSFSRAENLKIHARSHTGERPYVCPVPGCGKAYSNSSDRFKHTRTHSVDKPYMCKVPGCPKRYTDPSSLRKHVKTYRHFPPSSTTEEVSRQSPLAVAPRTVQADYSGALAMGCEDQEAKMCGNEECISPVPVPPRPEPETVYRSWLDTDLAVFSRSLPWTGLWVHPFLRPIACSPMEEATQDLPLDLTMHRAGTRV